MISNVLTLTASRNVWSEDGRSVHYSSRYIWKIGKGRSELVSFTWDMSWSSPSTVEPADPGGEMLGKYWQGRHDTNRTNHKQFAGEGIRWSTTSLLLDGVSSQRILTTEPRREFQVNISDIFQLSANLMFGWKWWKYLTKWIWRLKSPRIILDLINDKVYFLDAAKCKELNNFSHKLLYNSFSFRNLFKEDWLVRQGAEMQGLNKIVLARSGLTVHHCSVVNHSSVCPADDKREAKADIVLISPNSTLLLTFSCKT